MIHPCLPQSCGSVGSISYTISLVENYAEFVSSPCHRLSHLDVSPTLILTPVPRHPTSELGPMKGWMSRCKPFPVLLVAWYYVISACCSRLRIALYLLQLFTYSYSLIPRPIYASVVIIILLSAVSGGCNRVWRRKDCECMRGWINGWMVFDLHG